jgi:hypothetical protein
VCLYESNSAFARIILGPLRSTDKVITAAHRGLLHSNHHELDSIPEKDNGKHFNKRGEIRRPRGERRERKPRGELETSKPRGEPGTHVKILERT